MEPIRRTAPTYYVLVVVLVTLLLAAVGFIVAMAMRPEVRPAAFARAATREVGCSEPAAEGTKEACYEASVQNTGTESGTFNCRVMASGEVTTAFTNGSDSIRVDLDGGATQIVGWKVVASKDASIGSSAVSCAVLEASPTPV
jgi:hypothetical protein